jgi:sugar/nucleoside kinase (ribokinase family)
VTLDEHGCVSCCRDRSGGIAEEFVDPVPVEHVVDTTGAGDSFAAGHCFVSLLSDAGAPTEKIAACRHGSTTTTGRVYRHQIRPVAQGGAQIMDGLFAKPGGSGA